MGTHRQNRIYSCPPSVTFLGIASLTGAASAVIVGTVLLLRPDQESLWGPFFLLVRAALFGVGGGFLLAGANWARIFYLTICLPIFIGSLLLRPDAGGIAAILLMLLLCSRLFSSGARLFFTGDDGHYSSHASRHHDRESGHSSRRGRFDY